MKEFIIGSEEEPRGHADVKTAMMSVVLSNSHLNNKWFYGVPLASRHQITQQGGENALPRCSGVGKLSGVLSDLVFSGKMNNLLLACLAVAEEASRGQQYRGRKEPKQQQQRRR